MQIDPNLLISYGASSRKYKKGETIFHEDKLPQKFFQIVEGDVKVFCSNSEGKELIQGIFKTGESFGEPPLFVNKLYPSTAIAISDSIIISLAKDTFFTLLDDYPEIVKVLLKTFATRIYNKASTVQIMICHTPEEKVIAFLKKYKLDNNLHSTGLVPFTRQQIADITGLRVETVIRTLSKLSKNKKVEIINRKVYY